MVISNDIGSASFGRPFFVSQKMNQTVIIKDYEADKELEVLSSLRHVVIQIHGRDEGASFAIPPESARELARVLNLFATFAEAEGGADAKE